MSLTLLSQARSINGNIGGSLVVACTGKVVSVSDTPTPTARPDSDRWALRHGRCIRGKTWYTVSQRRPERHEERW
ncbi:hypothetical protein K438DRAFT_296205 [Mycena galopus ATCC 62051]|nr:hypothetical protein K438DRAFT_296205 [Mycena galopus ATCC 62051]